MSRRLNPASLGLRLAVLAIIAVAALTGNIAVVATTVCAIVLAWMSVLISKLAVTNERLRAEITDLRPPF